MRKIFALVWASRFSSGKEVDPLFSLLFHPFLHSDVNFLPYEERS